MVKLGFELWSGCSQGLGFCFVLLWKILNIHQRENCIMITQIPIIQLQ